MVNGNGSKWIVTLVVTIAIALLGGAFAAGVHVGNDEIHQSRSQKLTLVHEVVDREIAPQLKDIRRELEYVNLKLDAMAKEASK